MADVLIVGAGVVGKATGDGLSSFGHAVVFKDTDPIVSAGLEAEGKQTWSDGQNVFPELVFICVPSPTVNGRADLSLIEAACRDLKSVLANGSEFPVVVVRSTVPPGSMDEHIIPWLEEASGGKEGQDFGVCYNPELLRRVSADSDFLNPWAIVIGSRNRLSLAPLLKALEPVIERNSPALHLTDLLTAELTKYVANLFNATKISFSNEVWQICRALGSDGNGVLAIASTAAEGMWNPAYGIRGGSPFGGGCLPKDLEAFLGFASDVGMRTPLLEAVAEVNGQSFLDEF